MEVLSTTNPIPPTGGTNAIAPLGITAALSITKTSFLTDFITPVATDVQRPILLSQFTCDSTSAIGTSKFKWSTYNTNLTNYDPNNTNGFIPWNLVKPYYSKMFRMDYEIIFKAYKVTDAETKLHALWTYTDDSISYNTDHLANHNQEFSFDDSSDLTILQVPQFFMHNNVVGDIIYRDSLYSLPAFLPKTNLELFVANRYQPSLMHPETFKVQVFLQPIPSNMKVVHSRRTVTGGYPTNTNVHPSRPYFLTAP